MVGAVTERYIRADFWTNKIKLITRTNATIQSTQKENLYRTTIFYNEAGNKSTSGKYFAKSCVSVVAIELLFSVTLVNFGCTTRNVKVRNITYNNSQNIWHKP